MEMKRKVIFLTGLVIFLSACTSLTPLPTPSPSLDPSPIPPTDTTQPAAVTPLSSATPIITPSPQPQSVMFAVIGDYGENNSSEADVAALVHGWQPDFIITVGDNNYPLGAAETIDVNVGQYYHDFIYPYTGAYGGGADVNRFFPTLGNHDWYTQDAQPYLDYFTLPGNERYYDF